MPVRQLTEYLDANRVRYMAHNHAPTFTAQETAEATHISGKEMAKPIIIEVDGKHLMVVTAACERIDFESLSDALGGEKIRLCHEDEFEDEFPYCETGSMPPFGNLYGMPVILSAYLSSQDSISFNAGSHTEIVQMDMIDYCTLTRPRVARFTLLH